MSLLIVFHINLFLFELLVREDHYNIWSNISHDEVTAKLEVRHLNIFSESGLSNFIINSQLFISICHFILSWSSRFLYCFFTIAFVGWSFLVYSFFSFQRNDICRYIHPALNHHIQGLPPGGREWTTFGLVSPLGECAGTYCPWQCSYQGHRIK